MPTRVLSYNVAFVFSGGSVMARRHTRSAREQFWRRMTVQWDAIYQTYGPVGPGLRNVADLHTITTFVGLVEHSWA